MMTALLIIIFFSFIGVGLPDSVLGTAWPTMYREFDLPVSLAGYISATSFIGSITSSMLSARLIKRFGTGGVTAFCTLLTAAALLSYSFAGHPAFLFILAIPMGLGGGSVDTALNAFVSTHYSAACLNFLHCFYGLGVAASPFVMSLALGEDGNWRKGYMAVAVMQFVLAVICFCALPLWKKVQKRDAADESIVEQRILSFKELIKIPGVAYSGFAFCFACALELSAGAWSATYFVDIRGLRADRAAMITMLFYIGLASGRFVSGIVTPRLGRRRVLRISLALLPAAIVLFALPVNLAVTAVGLFMIGFSIGPVYPNLVHLTPKNFGDDIAQSVMGYQQTLTYIGIMVFPSIFGILAQLFSAEILPYFLVAMYLLYLSSFVVLMKKVKRNKKAGNKAL